MLSLSRTTHVGSCQRVEDCYACSRQKSRELKTESRTSCKDVKENVLLNTVVRSVDMQKVIMLPCLQGVKTVCFTRSLAVFHETFAPIRKYKAIIHTISGNWHERISERKAKAWQAYSSKYYTKSETISKSYTLVILFCQEQKLVLFSELVNIINSDRILAQTISSTFMSADSIHTC